MGLDWMVHRTRPREGCEARFAEITKMLEEIRDDEARSPALEEELREISVTMGEVLGAPRIGEDDRATNWFRVVYDENRERAAMEDASEEFARYWARPFEEIVEENRGKYVLELAEDQGGLGEVTGIAASSADFRGKIVGRCPLLSHALQEEAYEDHGPEEMLDYARRLEEELSGRALEGEDAEWAESVRAGIRWLRFWGEKGFGFYAWY